jgi:hypothetical protein
MDIVRWSGGDGCFLWSRIRNARGLWFFKWVLNCNNINRNNTPPRQEHTVFNNVYAVQQAVSKVSTWSALHNFARHDWPVPDKGWDEVGPDHPFLSVRIQGSMARG